MKDIGKEATEVGTRFVDSLAEKGQLILADYLPRTALALVIILVGWLAAAILRKLAVKLCRTLGFDVLGEKSGLKRFLVSRGIDYSPSGLIGLAVYWLILFAALITAFDYVGLKMAADLLRLGLDFIPKLIAAVILIGIGIFLADWLGELVTRLCRLAQIPFHQFLGQLARVSIIAITAINVLEFLGLASQSILLTGLIAASAIGVLLLFIFTISARTTAGSILSRQFLERDLKEGDRVAFDGVAGTVEKIDTVRTRIRTRKGVLFIPNLHLLEQSVTKSEEASGE